MLVEPPAIARVGVIGAGQMGNGIAHVCALAGFEVQLAGRQADALDRAMATMSRNMDRQVNRTLISPEDKMEALARIKPGTDYAHVRRRRPGDRGGDREGRRQAGDLQAVGAASEAGSCLLASNTSSISITRLGAATDRPEKFIGMHFMNPVPVMKLVEIIRGIATDEPTFQAVQTLAHEAGQDHRGGGGLSRVHRQPHPGADDQRGGLRAVRGRGVGVGAIDTSMRLGANHPMGPLELADFIGLDTCLSIMQVLYEGLSDSKYRPCPLLVKYVEAGWLGRKTNRGFYDYTQNPPRPTR